MRTGPRSLSQSLSEDYSTYFTEITTQLSLKAQILVSTSFNSTGINNCYWKTRSNSPKHLLLFKITEKLSNLCADSHWCVCRAVRSCLTQAASDTVAFQKYNQLRASRRDFLCCDTRRVLQQIQNSLLLPGYRQRVTPAKLASVDLSYGTRITVRTGETDPLVSVHYTELGRLTH